METSGEFDHSLGPAVQHWERPVEIVKVFQKGCPGKPQYIYVSQTGTFELPKKLKEKEDQQYDVHTWILVSYVYIMRYSNYISFISKIYATT